MDDTMIGVLVGLAGIAAILTVLVQLGKELIPEQLDAEGNEAGLRRFLAPAIMLIGLLLGILVGFVRGEFIGPDKWEGVVGWAFAGFLTGAISVGFYSGLKGLVPGLFSSSGWLGGGRG
jgi:hypothetical protein